MRQSRPRQADSLPEDGGVLFPVQKNIAGKSDEFGRLREEDHMQRKANVSEVVLSYEELKCLEDHFRQLQKEAVVDTLKKTAGDAAYRLGKVISTMRSVDQLKSAKTDS